MGSEKKRKRVSVEPGAADATPTSLDKAERKRLKKLKKERENGALAHAGNGTAPESENKGQDQANVTEVKPLLSPIASPMAGRKLTKKLTKFVGHVAKEKCLRRGIKEVVLGLRKSDTGIVVLAGDVFPVDVIAHIPLLCEEANVPYCFISTKMELGNAGLTKRPTSVLMVSSHKMKDKEDLKKELAEMKDEVKQIQNLY